MTTLRLCKHEVAPYYNYQVTIAEERSKFFAQQCFPLPCRRHLLWRKTFQDIKSESCSISHLPNIFHKHSRVAVNPERMTMFPEVALSDGTLYAYGQSVLKNVPDNVSFTPDDRGTDGSGGFLGASSPKQISCHQFSLGSLIGSRFLSCYRFKLWWMTQRIGTKGSEVPLETQFLLLECGNQSESQTFYPSPCGGDTDVAYIILLPLLEGAFRSSLSGGSKDQLMLSVESGDPNVTTRECLHAIYMKAGKDPFVLTSEAVRAVEDHSKSFMRREKKRLPGILDFFGWCTWDAFYTDVNVDGVHQGLSSLAAGGTPAKFLIIDDGWQSIVSDGSLTEEINLTVGTQYASRLADIKENTKFNRRVGHVDTDAAVDLGHVVKEMKEQHALKYVYVWHALMGYWGGVSHERASLGHHSASLVFPVHSEGVLSNQPDMANDSLTVNGLGVVHPERIHGFYNELHGYLASHGVDGVKVDVQAILETLGAGYGGRVYLAKVYHEALEASIAQNFPDNGIISCMSHHTDSIYSAKQTAVVRASDDFWPRDPASHTTHVASVAYNSLFLGEFMQPDWDMFHSLHPAAEYHAAARAVGGCAVYVSDKPGEHDFDVLRKLVLPDGTVLRAQLPGRPTRDSLFIDPARDKTSLLKIWNLNRCGGVIGVFNCQGAGWCTVNRKYSIHDSSPPVAHGIIRAMDVDSLASLAPANWNGDAVLYSHRGACLQRMSIGSNISISLNALEYEIFTVVPIQSVLPTVDFAPVGLSQMFNSGGAIMYANKANLSETTGVAEVQIGVQGCGVFIAYATKSPKACMVDGEIITFGYNASNGCIKIDLDFKEGHIWQVILQFALGQHS